MEIDDRINGVELLAIYGEDESLGFDLRRGFKKALRYSPGAVAYRMVKKGAHAARRRRLHGDEPELLGAFLPGLMKPLKKVGKYTSGITTGIAKTFVPSGVVDLVAKFDPTKKNKAKVTQADVSKALTPQQQAQAPASFLPASISPNVKKYAIYGAAGLAGLLALKMVVNGKK